MKKIVLLSLAIGFIFIGCEKNGEQAKTYEKISIEEAGVLILNWVFTDYQPDMNPEFVFDSITELTTDEIFSKLGGQVFSAHGNVPYLQDRWIFIRNKIVFDLHGYFGNQYANVSDRNNLVVTDLNRDSRYELFYTASWGSGIVRTTVNCFDPGYISKGAGINIAENQNSADYRLVKENDQELVIKHLDDVDYSVLLNEANGEIELTLKFVEVFPAPH